MQNFKVKGQADMRFKWAQGGGTQELNNKNREESVVKLITFLLNFYLFW